MEKKKVVKNTLEQGNTPVNQENDNGFLKSLIKHISVKNILINSVYLLIIGYIYSNCSSLIHDIFVWAVTPMGIEAFCQIYVFIAPKVEEKKYLLCAEFKKNKKALFIKIVSFWFFLFLLRIALILLCTSLGILFPTNKIINFGYLAKNILSASLLRCIFPDLIKYQAILESALGKFFSYSPEVIKLVLKSMLKNLVLLELDINVKNNLESTNTSEKYFVFNIWRSFDPFFNKLLGRYSYIYRIITTNPYEYNFRRINTGWAIWNRIYAKEEWVLRGKRLGSIFKESNDNFRQRVKFNIAFEGKKQCPIILKAVKEYNYNNLIKLNRFWERNPDLRENIFEQYNKNPSFRKNVKDLYNKNPTFRVFVKDVVINEYNYWKEMRFGDSAENHSHTAKPQKTP